MRRPTNTSLLNVLPIWRTLRTTQLHRERKIQTRITSGDLLCTPTTHAGTTQQQIYVVIFFLIFSQFFRPNSAEVDKNNFDHELDGGVQSTVAAAANEGTVSDFLRREATSDYDFR